MLIHSNDLPFPFVYYLLTKYEQYVVIKDLLIPKIIISAKEGFKNSSYDFLVDLIEANLKNRNNNFGLWIGFNTKTREIITYSITFITTDDDMKPICLIYTGWVNMKYCHFLYETVFEYYDKWAIERSAQRIVFYMSHKMERIISIFKRYGWQWSKIAMSKELN